MNSNKHRLLFISAILLSVVLCAGNSLAEDLSVKVKSARLRSSPQHWAPATATLAFGNQVTALEANSGWIKVKTSRGQQGYLHESALSDRKIVLKASSAQINGTTSSDVVLAGKGFNKEVEKQFMTQNPTAAFAEVNRMEALSLKESDLIAFMKSGGLKSNA